ncbi:hypothetical protein BN6_39670 [Saccharothrix espanaensis DSM 44229]|uniref:Uncharacterized protein n=1 Tax=Saccharothrix espanaensis (strain ATCC 51144 / DSM 44229 / JCM 9112 / NBRC 15066 / NRRL 15764) TaxID=1179773 RepID=K0K2Z9_SACES|nr:hypothetical protein BN6_39670 [Saccharothrix espanaensis DSM 44229]
MTTGVDTLATAFQVRTDDLLKAAPGPVAAEGRHRAEIDRRGALVTGGSRPGGSRGPG